jgi:prolyl oligopeptidase
MLRGAAFGEKPRRLTEPESGDKTNGDAMLTHIVRPLHLSCACACLVLLPVFKAAAGQNKQPPAPPPLAPVRPVTDDYYGAKVVDPYRYMENLKDPEVLAWMKAQNDYCRAMLARIPARQKLLERIRQLDQSVPQVQATRLPGDRYLVLKRLSGDNTAKLYLRQGLEGKDKLLVDPGQIKLAPANQGKGKNVVLYFSPSLNDRYVAVGIAPGGSEPDTEIHVIETATGRETGEVIPRAWGGSPSWLPDNRSFVYVKLQKLPPGAPVTEKDKKIRAYLHVVGANPDNDQPVFGYGVVQSIPVDPLDDGLVITPPKSDFAIGEIDTGVSPNSAFYIEPIADLGKTNAAWRKVADFSDEVGANLAPSIAVHGDEVFLLTYKNAPRYKVIRTDARNPDLTKAESVVPPGRAVIAGIYPAEDALYVELLDGGINRVLRVAYGPKPKVKEVRLPFKGVVGIQTDPRLPGALLRMRSWTKADSIYAYNPRTKQVTHTRLQPTGPYDNPGNVESVEVKVPSYDGTLVPLSIIYPKGIKLDGSNPTLLYGYGAYGITELPRFERTWLAWYEKGGVIAVAHVRGGGAYGEEWHLAGKGPAKPNTWRDFIACARYLIHEKYTSPAHLAGMGMSAGGITIGRAITTRPDLFAAAVDWVGISDTLRFETTANGAGNIAEFGSVKTEPGFKALYAMSPYAHVKPGTPYPAVLVMTGMNDPRVNPWQMAKMAARLEAATSGGRPVLLRVDYHGGHNVIGATKTDSEETFADIFSFLFWQLGAPGFQPKK